MLVDRARPGRFLGNVCFEASFLAASAQPYATVAMATRWLLSGFVGFLIGFGFPWIRTCRPFMSHVVPDQSRLQEEDQAPTHVMPDEPRLQEKTVPEVGQAQPSRLHYEGLQLYSQPASPDEVWKSLKKLSKGSQIQLKHYRVFFDLIRLTRTCQGLNSPCCI